MPFAENELINPAVVTSGEDVHFDAVAIARRLIRGWRVILLGTLAGVAVAVAIAYLTKPWYVADAVFLPPKDTDIGAGAPVSFVFGTNDASDSYLGMLGSRSVADDVIDQLNLMQVFKAGTRTAARNALAASSKFSVSKNSMIIVEVRYGDGKIAAQIANAYLAALYRLNGHMVDSASDHRRAFFEQQLESARAALAQAELGLKNTQQRTGVVLPGSEAQAGLNTTQQLQSMIGAAETRLAGLKVGHTDQSPEVVEANSELSQLRLQLARQQSDSARGGPGAGLAPNGQLPALTLEYARKDRELKLRENVYNGLVQQYERARLAASDPGPQFEVVDQAIQPEIKAGPKRRLIVSVGFAVGFVLSVGYLLAIGTVRRFVRLVLESSPAGLD